MKWHEVAGVAVGCAGLVGWLAWVLITRMVIRRRQRVRGRAEPSMDLGAETPAVASLLLNDTLPSGDALAATFLDLAARRHLDIVQLSPTDHLLVPRTRPRDQLRPYELQLLTVLDRARGDQPHVTVGQLREALDQDSVMTWAQFTFEVQREARERSLIASPPVSATLGMLVCLVPNLGLVLYQPMLYLLCVVGFLLLFLPGVLLIVVGRGSVLTDRGQAAGRRWHAVRDFLAEHPSLEELPAGAVAIWDRYLAYGAALGVSDEAVATIVDELRTTLTTRDLWWAARETRRGLRAQRDPGTRREWRREQLRGLHGSELDPDAIYGPEGGTWIDLLRTAGRSWPLAEHTRSTDPEVWEAASLRRIALVEAAAPPELARDARLVAAAGRRGVEICMIPIPLAVGLERLRTDPAIVGPEVRSAALRFAQAVGTELDCGSGVREVVEAVLLAPFRAEDLLADPEPSTGARR